MEKKEVSKKIYTFEIVHYDDGSSVMNRFNDGFSVMEILGITSLVNGDMRQLIKDNFIVPKKVNRVSKNSKFIDKK